VNRENHGMEGQGTTEAGTKLELGVREVDAKPNLYAISPGDSRQDKKRRRSGRSG